LNRKTSTINTVSSEQGLTSQIDVYVSMNQYAH